MALQKTYASTSQFPKESLLEEGYESVIHSRDGEYRNGWGVAVLARKPHLKPKPLQVGLPCDREARFLTVRVADLDFSSVYAPYRPVQKKLEWLEQLHKHLERRSPRSKCWVLAGDLNVAPEGANRTQLDSLLQLGFYDLYRHCHPDRTSCDYEGFNYGFDIHKPPNSRLHLILGTKAIVEKRPKAWVDLNYRQRIADLNGEKWAPAAPVVVDI